MREIAPESKAPAYPWLWVCVILGPVVVYALMSSYGGADALAAAEAKASVRGKQLQGQIDALRKALAESDGRLASANLRIQELVIEREKRKSADFVMNEAPRQHFAPLDETSKPKLLAEALKARDLGNLAVAKAKCEAILAIDANDLGASEMLKNINYEIAGSAPAGNGIPAGYTKEWVLAWANVTKGLSRDQVKAILGDALKIEPGTVEEWYYSTDTQHACVFFFNGKVNHFNGP